MSANSTMRRLPDGTIEVVLYSTLIIKLNKDQLTLNSGGYRTATTKRYINKYLKQLSISYQIIQRSFQWFVINPNVLEGSCILFSDNMTLEVQS